jgi:hypothetical protein
VAGISVTPSSVLSILVMDQCLSKPFTPGDLARKVREVLGVTGDTVS